MTRFYSCSRLLRVITAAALGSTVSFGAVIYDSGVTALTASDPTQLGRISRNGVVSDWSSPKPFPGILNPATSYNYETFAFADSSYRYVQVSFDSLSTETFASAYKTSYDPTDLALNYLGDPGTSGNFFGTDPLVFQVLASIPAELLVVVNTTSPAGLGVPFRILVEGFTSPDFSDTVPEPSAAMLSFAGLGAAGILLLVRRRKSVS